MNILSQVANEIKGLITGSIVNYVPDYVLKDFEKEKIVIVPTSIKYDKATRAEYKATLTLEIGIVKRITDAEIVSMIDRVNDITLVLLDAPLLNKICICKEINNNPIYDIDSMVSEKKFISILQLRYETI